MSAVVVGGGIAGLVAARDLVRAGVETTLLDAGSVPGGHARTTEENGFAWEWGPHTITSTADAVHDLTESLGLSDELVRTSGPSTRYIYRNGVLHAIGPGSRVLSARGWLRIFAEPFLRSQGPADETVSDFFARRIGQEAADVLVGSFVSGIYAGDAHVLGIADAFPKLAQWEREHGSLVKGAFAHRKDRKGPKRGIRGFRRGTGTLTRALADELGDRLVAEARVTSITRKDGVWSVRYGRKTAKGTRLVVATPPPIAAPLLAEHVPAITALADTPMAPVAVVHLMGHKGEPPRGFGALIPRGEGIRTLGVLFVSSQLPSRAPGDSWLLTAFIGGATDPEAPSLPDDELVAQVIADIAKMTGFTADVDAARVVRHAAAIPQLTPGHLDRVAALQKQIDALGSLAVAGNWTLGVSLDHAVQSGHLAAEKVLS